MPHATVIVTSRNRRETCAKTVASALAQTGGEFEVVVVDDASDDDTAAYIREQFPVAVVHRIDRRGGYIAARNLATRLARSPIVVSIDDDAVFVDEDTLAKTVAEFDHPRVGAVCVPFVNHHNGVDEQCIVPKPPDVQHIWLTNTFVGTAYAVRRDVFLALGGFDERLVHWAEEAEFCVRLFAAGYVTRIGTGGLIRHFPAAPGKYNLTSYRRMYRNGVFSIWVNVPTLWAAPIMGVQFTRAAIGAVKTPRHFLAAAEGLPWGLASMIRHWPTRRPISRAAYRLWLEVRRRKPVRLDEIESRLPPLVSSQSSSSPLPALAVADV